MLNRLASKDQMKMLNMASVQDTANSHTEQMGDFKTPMYFERVLPPTTNHIVWGSLDPPYGRLRGYLH